MIMMIGAAMLLVGIAGSASAQNYPVELPEPLPPVGNIANVPSELSGTQDGLLGSSGNVVNLSDNAAAFQTPLITVDADAAVGGTGGAGGDELAFTGVDSNLLTAGGMALVLIGGGALVASRRRD